MERILFIILGYCFGMIQSAYFVGRHYKIDMREHGSKNLGTTNALRTLGAKAGIIVFILDLVKPMLAILVSSLLAKYVFTNTDYARELIVLYTGFGVMLGHNYPFYLGFKGGKGVACTIGTILVLSPLLLLIIFAVGVIIVAISRYISLASILCSVFTVIMLYVYGLRGEPLYLITVIALFIIFKHRANIKRLITGTENKFTIKKKAV